MRNKTLVWRDSNYYVILGMTYTACLQQCSTEHPTHLSTEHPTHLSTEHPTHLIIYHKAATNFILYYCHSVGLRGFSCNFMTNKQIQIPSHKLILRILHNPSSTEISGYRGQAY